MDFVVYIQQIEYLIHSNLQIVNQNLLQNLIEKYWKKRFLPLPVPQQACNKLSLQITWSLSSPNNLQLTIELITKSFILGGCCCCCWDWLVLPKIEILLLEQ